MPPVSRALAKRLGSLPLAEARWERFCQLMVAGDLTMRAAYEAAGHTGAARSLTNRAKKLMQRSSVAARIAYLQDQAAHKAVVDGAAALRRAEARASVTLADIVTWDADGNVTLKPTAELPRDVRLALKRIKGRQVTRRVGPGGEVIETIRGPELELHDPQAPNHDILVATGQLGPDSESRTPPVTVNVWGPPAEPDGEK